MPFSAYDPAGDNLDAYLDSGVSLVVLLASDEECFIRTGRDLRKVYQSNNLEVVYLPVEDFNIPEPSSLDKALDRVVGHMSAGGVLAVHCHAGIGRTGVFTACLARRLMGVSGEEAILWIRRFIPGAIELPGQEVFVREYQSFS
jgi:protein-tyrosine phosphatase